MAEINTNLLGAQTSPSEYDFGGSPDNALKLANYIRTQQLQRQELARNNTLAQMYAKHYDPSTGEVNYNNLIGEASQNNLTAPAVPDLVGAAQKAAYQSAQTAHQLELAGQEKATAAAKTGEIEDAATKQALQLSRSQLENVSTPEQLLAWHEQNHANPRLQKLFGSMDINKDARTAELQATLAQPNGFETALGKSKNALDSLIDLKSFQERQDKAVTVAETARHNKAMEAIGQERADAYTTRMKELGLNAKSYPFVSEAIANGKLSPARVNSRNAGFLNDALKLNPDLDINQLTKMAISGEAGARTLGTTAANQAAAGEEAGLMIPIARQYANLVNSGEFKSLNELGNFADRQTGDKAIVRLNMALNSLVNSYARAINPKGIPTVSDKKHAQQLVDSALSNGQLNATLDVMEQEIAAARAGTEAARTSVIGGKPAAAAAPTLSAQDQEALNWANANANDPRAAKIKARLKVQ